MSRNLNHSSWLSNFLAYNVHGIHLCFSFFGIFTVSVVISPFFIINIKFVWLFSLLFGKPGEVYNLIYTFKNQMLILFFPIVFKSLCSLMFIISFLLLILFFNSSILSGSLGYLRFSVLRMACIARNFPLRMIFCFIS